MDFRSFVVNDSSFFLLCSLFSFIVVHYARDCSCTAAPENQIIPLKRSVKKGLKRGLKKKGTSKEGITQYRTRCWYILTITV